LQQTDKKENITMIVANPIYDVVFKYLMEDERIARTILSALLKKEVVEVHMRRNEYSNKSRDTLSALHLPHRLRRHHPRRER